MLYYPQSPPEKPALSFLRPPDAGAPVEDAALGMDRLIPLPLIRHLPVTEHARDNSKQPTNTNTNQPGGRLLTSGRSLYALVRRWLCTKISSMTS